MARTRTQGDPVAAATALNFLGETIAGGADPLRESLARHVTVLQELVTQGLADDGTKDAAVALSRTLQQHR